MPVQILHMECIGIDEDEWGKKEECGKCIFLENCIKEEDLIKNQEEEFVKTCEELILSLYSFANFTYPL